MVTCDMSGRIVDFQIQEGKGDLKSHIVALKNKWDQELPETPIMVFDREGHGAPFFNTLIENEIPFVTWEKHVDSKKLKEIDADLFSPDGHPKSPTCGHLKIPHLIIQKS